MSNPFTNQLLTEIEDAQLAITGNHADVKDLWVLLERVQIHLRALSEHTSEILGALEALVADKATIDPEAPKTIEYPFGDD